MPLPAPPIELVPTATWERLNALFRSDPYARQLGAHLQSWSPGTATVEWEPSDDQVNFAGGVHGGAIFSLADLAFSYACNSWGRAAVALSVSIEFLAPATAARTLVAVATEKSRRHQVGAYAIDVSDRDGELVASCSAVAFRTQQWHLGEHEWPPEWRAAV